MTFPLRGADGRKALAVFLTQFLARTPTGRGRSCASRRAPVHRYQRPLPCSDAEYFADKPRDASRPQRSCYPTYQIRAAFEPISIWMMRRAWSELDWVGKTLKSGNVLLEIVRRTSRCPATSVDLERGMRDLNVPRSILDYRGHGDCGIYAEILSPGRLQPRRQTFLAG